MLGNEWEDVRQNPKEYILKPLVNLELNGIQLRLGEFYEVQRVTRTGIIIAFRQFAEGKFHQTTLLVPESMVQAGMQVRIEFFDPEDINDDVIPELEQVVDRSDDIDEVYQ